MLYELATSSFMSSDSQLEEHTFTCLLKHLSSNTDAIEIQGAKSTQCHLLGGHSLKIRASRIPRKDVELKGIHTSEF